MDLTRALFAETLKMKRTLALWLALIAPVVVALLQLAMVYQRGAIFLAEADDDWIWFVRQSLLLWSLLMLPLFVTLETALLAQMEHGNKTWKQLYAIPISHQAVIAAKQIWSLVLIGFSMLALWFFLILAGLLLRVTRPDLEFGAPVPWLQMLKFTVLNFLASWLIIAIHSWVSTRWPSFVVASGVGIVATTAGFLFSESEWGGFYPWTLPAVMIYNYIVGSGLDLTILAIGCLGGLALFILGNWEVSRKDVL